MVHFFVEEARDEIDLYNKWLNPPSEEETMKMEKFINGKSKKSTFEPLVD